MPMPTLPGFTLLLLCCQLSTSFAVELNGFTLDGSAVPASSIHAGGPGRDGIPALTDPLFLPASEATFPAQYHYVLGLQHNGISKAYPVAILDRHEVVNDLFNGQPVAVTWCPLCGSGVAYDATIQGRRRLFGVSGLLYNSDVLLFDRGSESLWSQLMASAISGPLQGHSLQTLPLLQTTWGEWQTRHPDTLVLSPATGHDKNYRASPYRSYATNRTIAFPVAARGDRYHPKERVLGVILKGAAKAYPFSELANHGPLLRDQLAGQSIQIQFDRTTQSAQALTTQQQPLPATTLYWFAWIAFHPETAVFKADQSPGQ